MGASDIRCIPVAAGARDVGTRSPLVSRALGLVRLDTEHEVLRRDGAYLAEAGEAIAALVHELRGLGHVIGNEANLGQGAEQVGQRLAHPRVCREQVGRPVELQVCPPRPCVVAVLLLEVLHEVEVLLDLEAGCADLLEALLDAGRASGAVAVEMPPHEFLVLWVGGVPAGQEVVLHRHEAATGLKKPVRLLEGLGAIFAVQGALHVEGRVVGVLLQTLHVQIVLHNKVAARLHPGRERGGDFLATHDLVLVDGETGDVGARRAHDAAQGAANAAAHVEHAVHVGHLQLLRNKVLRVKDGFRVRLVASASAKVEGVAPAVLVELRGQVVEAARHVSVVRVVLRVAIDG
mmetsp:Transcript_9616/g.28126  ORF Transcript_9616/g.28126 Transcript_9616/m.28126 type:complete len:348 (+) Transcript_9616:533-1576(+)